MWKCIRPLRIHYQHTRIFSIACILCPLAARGVNSDGRSLSLYTLSCGKMCSPAAHMVAPELESTWTLQSPWCVSKCTFTVGAGSMVDNCFRLMVLKPGGLSSSSSLSSVIPMAQVAGESGGFFCSLRPWQNDCNSLAVAACLLVGWAPLWWACNPHPGQGLGPGWPVCDNGTCFMRCLSGCRMARTEWSVMSWRCFLYYAASWAWQVVMVAS